MEKANFAVTANHSITVDHKHVLDLHNDFDFNSLIYDANLGQVSLSWTKSEGDWVAEAVPQKIKMNFDGVSFFSTQIIPKEHDKSDRLTLSFVGYLHPEDIGLMDGCLDERESDWSYHMIFSFENGLAVKIYSDQVRCSVA